MNCEYKIIKVKDLFLSYSNFEYIINQGCIFIVFLLITWTENLSRQ